MKMSIKAELAYSSADATQIIANIEASHTSDQSVLSETLDFQPPAKILSDKSPYGDRRIRASLSGDVNIRYVALVENNVRRLLSLLIEMGPPPRNTLITFEKLLLRRGPNRRRSGPLLSKR